MSDWNSTQYLKFKAERTQPSIDLVKSISLTDPQNIIDIGCGPGNSTRVLKDRFPNARVIGADFSPNMIEKAKKENPDLEFTAFDASRDFDKLDIKFDVVFSNACIQWVPNHKKLLADIMSVLNDGGMLAVQVPVTAEQDMSRVIDTVTDLEQWKKLKGARIFYTLNDYEYFNILSDISSDFKIWKTIYYHRLPSHQSVLEWYRSTGLKPYFDKLDDKESVLFEKDILAEIERQFPVQPNGEIIFRFPRLFFTAVK